MPSKDGHLNTSASAVKTDGCLALVNDDRDLGAIGKLLDFSDSIPVNR